MEIAEELRCRRERTGQRGDEIGPDAGEQCTPAVRQSSLDGGFMHVHQCFRVPPRHGSERSGRSGQREEEARQAYASSARSAAPTSVKIGTADRGPDIESRYWVVLSM